MSIKEKSLEPKEKFEELKPLETLIKIGFKDGMKLCDIGAGTGSFTFEASKLSKEEICALEISDELIDYIKSKANKQKIKNIVVKKVISDNLPVKDNYFDMIILVTVLHGLKKKNRMIGEAKRILKKSGKLIIIEFNNKVTSTSSFKGCKIEEKKILEMCKNKGLKKVSKEVLGDSFYSLTFEESR